MNDSKFLSRFFFLFFVITTFASSYNECPTEQSEALLLFKHSLDSINYTTQRCQDKFGSGYEPKMISWNTSTNCCSWTGVTCDLSTGDVINIDVNCGMLKGTIHPNSSLFNLRHLRGLVFSNNRLNGTLSSLLHNFPSLESLALGDNMFSGNVQFSVGQLSKLVYLDLSSNNFSGELEFDTLLTSHRNLKILNLSYSGFSLTTKNANHYVNPGFLYLFLASCKLKVFPNSLRAMQQLERLDLSNNEIYGEIPDWFGEIGGNRFSSLDLSHNSITGLPQRFQWRSLRYLNLQSNLIEGPLPPSICKLIFLVILDISNNSFGGVIPECVSSMNTLYMINLENNNFHGTIPDGFNDCGGLEGFILNGNQLEGEVPHSLSNCHSLKVVDLGNNKLNGTFPEWLGGLLELQVLVLKSNNFHARIEASFAAFSSLQVLDLSHNWFSGKLPGFFFQNFKAMQNLVRNSSKPVYLSTGNKYYSIIVMVKDVQLRFTKVLVDYTIVDLSNNRFDGEIPNSICSLNSLKVLNLSHNSLTGPLPHALGNLTESESLDLSWNQLSGEIPQSLAEIKGLAVLSLSENHLVGRIPKGTQFNTFDENSFEGNPGLCGLPLTKMCSEHTQKPQLESHEDESGFTWQVVTLGYGSGTLVGLVMGYLMLSTRKVKWFNAIADAGEQVILLRNKRRYVFIGR